MCICIIIVMNNFNDEALILLYALYMYNIIM